MKSIRLLMISLCTASGCCRNCHVPNLDATRLINRE